jgi:hypothetical protein
MDYVEVNLMSKDSFLKDVSYTKEPYEGILVSADSKNNQYKIGVQLGENLVLQVDQVRESEVEERVRKWLPRVNQIQMQYGIKNDLENYSGD